MADNLNDVLAEIMAEQQASEPITNEGSAEPSSVEETPAAEIEQPAPETAPQTAETPMLEQNSAEVANGQLQQVLEQNQQLMTLVNQLKGALEQTQNTAKEMNQANEEKIVQTLTEPPTLDFEALAYMSDEERMAEQARYTAAMAEFMKQTVSSELAPIKQEYERQTREAEEQKIISAFANDPKFEGFRDEEQNIKTILGNVPELASLPADKRYFLGYLINRGAKDVQKPKVEESTESLVQRVLSNPEALKAIEKQRAAQQATVNRTAPPVTASQGQSNAPALSDDPPLTLADASAQVRKAFGL